MAAPRWTLISPANSRATYEFQINPSEEEEFGKRRSIEHGANTADTGFVRQQSDDSPLILKATGTIFHESQHEELIAWWGLCKTETIHLIDHAGDEYEVMMTAYVPKRKRTSRNPRDFANAPLWYWTYEIEFEIITVISGPWVGVG